MSRISCIHYVAIACAFLLIDALGAHSAIYISTAAPTPAPAPVAALIKQLSDPSEKVRTRATKALAAHGKDAVPSSIEAAQSDSYHARLHAIYALRSIGPDAKAAVPVLIKRLSDKRSSHIVDTAAETLGNIGPPAVEAAPHLIRLLDKDRTRFAPPRFQPALQKLGAGAAPAVKKALDNKPSIRLEGQLVVLLCHYGDQHAMPLFKHASPTVRILMARSKSGTEQGFKPIVALLDDDDARVRSVAAYVLRAYGERTLTQLDKLISMLGDEDFRVRASAPWSISAVGLKGKRARPALVEAGKDARVALSAGGALEGIGYPADAIACFIRALKSPSDITRYSAAMQLGDHGPSAKSAVPALASALSDTSRNVRRYSAEALGKIGPIAKDALPALEKLTKDDEADIRKKALEAIKKIEAK